MNDKPTVKLNVISATFKNDETGNVITSQLNGSITSTLPCTEEELYAANSLSEMIFSKYLALFRTE